MHLKMQVFFSLCWLLYFKNILFIYFLERGREGEREGEKHQCVVSSWPTTQALDWELNLQTFDSQAHAQSTKPYQPGQLLSFYAIEYIYIGFKLFLQP